MSTSPAARAAARSWFGVDDDLDFFDLHGDVEEAEEPGTAAPVGGRTALLLDVENYCPGSRASVRAVARLQALVAAAGQVEETVAIAADVTDRQRALLARVGIPVVSVPGGRDAADHALLAQARRLAATGVTRFLVASGDRIFAQIADLGELVVLTHAEHKVSTRLARAATEVRAA